MVSAGSSATARIASMSGVAMRRLERNNLGDLAMQGAGVQAYSQPGVTFTARARHSVRISSRSNSQAVSFAKRGLRQHETLIECMASATEAIANADFVAATTASKESIFGEWIVNGAHISTVGANVTSTRKLVTTAVVRSRSCVDRRKSTPNKRRDLLCPIKVGALNGSHICSEITGILSGRSKGRESHQYFALCQLVTTYFCIITLAATHHVNCTAIDRVGGTGAE